MRNPSIPLISLVGTLTLLTGCGGGGNAGSTPVSLAIGGGATTLTKTVETPVSSSPQPQSITVGGVPAVLPAGIALPTGPAAIVSNSTPVLAMSGSGSFKVDGKETNLNLTDGKLGANIVLPPTSGSAAYALSATAPAGGFNLGAPGKRLTVKGSITLGAPVNGDTGEAGIPTAISGTVPANGSSSAGVTVKATYPASFHTGWKARLTITYAGATMTQTQPIASDGTVSFSPAANGLIPADGINTLKIELVAL